MGKEKDVYFSGLIVENTNFISIPNLDRKITADVKIRYNSPSYQTILIPIDKNIIKVLFKEKQRAVTPGQSAVFYNNETVIGGGVIKKSIK